MNDYWKDSILFGEIVKREFPEFPWLFDRQTKSWFILGTDRNNFIQKISPNFDSIYHIYDYIKNKLGNTFNGHNIVFDFDDFYAEIFID